MQEFEFTVQDARLYLLQTRSGKRTPWAALRIAVEQLDEGLIGPEEATAPSGRHRARTGSSASASPAAEPRGGSAARPAPASASRSARSRLIPSARKRSRESGRRAILVRDGTLTDDIKGIAAAAGILTATGGRTSHAAVVARQLGKVCLVGCDALAIDLAGRRCSFAGEWFAEGDVLSLDGHTGEVYAGAVDVVTERPLEYLERAALLLEPARAA